MTTEPPATAPATDEPPPEAAPQPASVPASPAVDAPPLRAHVVGGGRQRPGIDLLLVLGVSLGQSAVYAVLSLINKLTYQVPLNQQTTTMNPSVTPDRPWLDLSYQVAGIVFPVVPALLALYLLDLAGQRRQRGARQSVPARPD